MRTEWKVEGSISLGNKPVLIARLRTEHEIILCPDSLELVKGLINQLKDDADLNTADSAHFAWELEQILDIYLFLVEKEAEDWGDKLSLISSEWKPFNGFLTLDTLKKMVDTLNDVNAFRLTGTVETGLILHMTFGADVLTVPLSENKITELQTSIALLNPVTITAVGVFLGGLSACLDSATKAWVAYKEQKAKEQEKKEEERRKAESERQEHERSADRAGHDCSGGPASDAMRERISRTC